MKIMRTRHHQDLLFSQWSKYESSQSGAAHSNPSGEGTFLLKVYGDADDGGEVDQAEPDEDNHDSQTGKRKKV